MIDVHSHIVFEVDDGSKSLEDSIDMVNEAKKAGFTDVIATPHYMEGAYVVPCDEIRKKIEIIQQNVSGINIYQGNEIYISGNMTKWLKNNETMGLNNSKYVLFETPMHQKPMNLDQAIYELLQEGKVPIIAHPERYLFVQENPNLLLDYIEQGVLCQTNYGSVMGKYGTKVQKMAKVLLQHGMIHFLGSDAHRPDSIYRNVPDILPTLKEWIGREKLKELTEVNPVYVLRNEEFEIDEPEMLQKGLFGWK